MEQWLFTGDKNKMATLENAILLAAQAHQGQTEKNGRPYVLHALRVMHQMRTDHEMMAAVLHDVVEDTSVTLDDLRQANYPQAVLEAVDCLTHREDESYDAYLDRVITNKIALRVKWADLKDNMDGTRLQDFTERDSQRYKKYVNARKKLEPLIYD